MTVLSDVRRGDQFLLAYRCTDRDATTGLTFNVYSAARTRFGQMIMSPAGVITGQLDTTPDQLPVSLVTGFSQVALGDVMSRHETGETMVCRWVNMKLDGTVQWSASPSGQVVYGADGWSIIAHVDI
jgi:hypothetical protein